MKAEWTNADSLSCEETTKAILVLNKMPKCCDGCPCTDYMFCYATQKELEIDWEVNKPSWCPLRPLPQAVAYEMTDTQTAKAVELIDNAFKLGWNACLEEIENDNF